MQQLRHRELPPALQASGARCEINLDGTPFKLCTTPRPWLQALVEGGAVTHPLRALINSFGAGGTSVCLLLEEHVPTARAVPAAATDLTNEELIVFSARTAEQLATMLADIRNHLASHADIRLTDLAYTLQVLREPMAVRWAMIARSCDEVIEAIDDFLQVRSSGRAPNSMLDVLVTESVPQHSSAALVEGSLGELIKNAVDAGSEKGCRIAI